MTTTTKTTTTLGALAPGDRVRLPFSLGEGLPAGKLLRLCEVGTLERARGSFVAVVRVYLPGSDMVRSFVLPIGQGLAVG